jgi:hypothetical protein
MGAPRRVLARTRGRSDGSRRYTAGAMKVTTDLGDWSSVPQRLRWAYLATVGLAFVVGLAAVMIGAPVSIGLLVSMNVGFGLNWLFTRRRSSWGDEGSGEEVIKPVTRRQAIGFALLDAVAVALVTGGSHF